MVVPVVPDPDTVLEEVIFRYRSGRAESYMGQILDAWEARVALALETLALVQASQAQPGEKDESLRAAIFGK